MDIIGIIAEYNPFHTGHAYQISASRAKIGKDAPVIAVMSGCWTQQAEDIGMDIFHRGLCLPSDNKMTQEEQKIVIEIIKSCFK